LYLYRNLFCIVEFTQLYTRHSIVCIQYI